MSIEPGCRFQPIHSRARSASVCVDDYYMDSREDRSSFVCSKPGFVCLVAVLFTVSFISLAFFLETGMPWREDQQNSPFSSNQVANASFRTHNSIQGKDSSKLITSDAANITDARSKGGGSGDVDTSKSESSDELFAKPAQEQLQEVVAVREPPKRPTVIKSKPLTNSSSGTSTLRPLSPSELNDESDVMYIFAPFDDSRHSQSRVVRGLMDTQGYGRGCTKEFTFHDLIEFMQIPSSSESDEENNFKCADLSEQAFEEMAAGFKKRMLRNSKYLFLVRDPRSLIYTSFDRHSENLATCIKNDSHRCLYDEEILGEAQVTMENWNARTQKMIELCHKLGAQTCQLLLAERIALKLLDTLESLAKFLVMDFEKDTFRVLNKMVQKVDEGTVIPRTEKETLMVAFLELLLKDTSGSWPWADRLPYNVFEHMPSWAPLMGKLGYGYSARVPTLEKDIVLEDLLRKN